MYETDRQTLENYLNTQFTATEIEWDNVDFEQFDHAEYLSCFIRHGKADLVSVGGTQKNYRRNGQLVLIIFTALGQGSKRNNDIADTLVDIFQGQQIDDIQFKSFELVNVGKNQERYRQNMYWYYEARNCLT